MNNVSRFPLFATVAAVVALGSPATAASHKGMYRHSVNTAIYTHEQFGTFVCNVKIRANQTIVNNCVHHKM
jgi:hypothetical protein